MGEATATGVPGVVPRGAGQGSEKGLLPTHLIDTPGLPCPMWNVMMGLRPEHRPAGGPRPPQPCAGSRESRCAEYVGVDTEGARCPSGTCSGPGDEAVSRWVDPLAGKLGGRQGSLCAVGVGLHHLAVHGHREGQAQDLRGHGGRGVLSGATCGHRPLLRMPPTLGISGPSQPPLTPAGITRLALARPARALQGGCIMVSGPAPPAGPSTLPLPIHPLWLRTQERWLPCPEVTDRA